MDVEKKYRKIGKVLELSKKSVEGSDFKTNAEGTLSFATKFIKIPPSLLTQFDQLILCTDIQVFGKRRG